MMRSFGCWLGAVACLAAVGCGGSDEGGGAGGAGGGGGAGGSGAGGSGGGGPPVITFACPGGAVAEGDNTLTIGGVARAFHADFPADTSAPMGVVFSWHGYGDTAANFRNLGLGTVSASFPFIVITPDDTALFPPAGLDWAIFDAAVGSANPDTAFFEGMLGCLNEQYTIEPTRLYTVGFSAGAIMSNLIYSRYPGLMASSAAWSGAWFNDPAQTSQVNTLGFAVNYDWEALDPGVGGTVLLTHGGSSDAFGFGAAEIINFEAMAQASRPFLAAGGRTVVDCEHTIGHQPHPAVREEAVIAFFDAHPYGVSSPWAAEGATLPDASCAVYTP